MVCGFELTVTQVGKHGPRKQEGLETLRRDFFCAFVSIEHLGFKRGFVQVEYVSPDAAELPDTRECDRKDTRKHVMPPSGFRRLVALDSPYLELWKRRITTPESFAFPER